MAVSAVLASVKVIYFHLNNRKRIAELLYNKLTDGEVSLSSYRDEKRSGYSARKMNDAFKHEGFFRLVVFFSRTLSSLPKTCLPIPSCILSASASTWKKVTIVVSCTPKVLASVLTIVVLYCFACNSSNLVWISVWCPCILKDICIVSSHWNGTRCSVDFSWFIADDDFVFV